MSFLFSETEICFGLKYLMQKHCEITEAILVYIIDSWDISKVEKWAVCLLI